MLPHRWDLLPASQPILQGIPHRTPAQGSEGVLGFPLICEANTTLHLQPLKSPWNEEGTHTTLLFSLPHNNHKVRQLCSRSAAQHLVGRSHKRALALYVSLHREIQDNFWIMFQFPVPKQNCGSITLWILKPQEDGLVNKGEPDFLFVLALWVFSHLREIRWRWRVFHLCRKRTFWKLKKKQNQKNPTHNNKQTQATTLPVPEETAKELIATFFETLQNTVQIIPHVSTVF